MTQIKYVRALGVYRDAGHHTGPRTIDAIWARIPAELRRRLTGRDLGLCMVAIHEAHQAGRAIGARQAHEA